MTILRALYEQIVRHCEETYPDEACGFLVRDGSQGKLVEVIRMTNVAREMRERHPEEFTRDATDGYVMDPREQLAAERRVEAAKRSICGVYHSHPDVGAYFSEEDERRATPFGEPLYPEWLVVDVQQGAARGARHFRWGPSTRGFAEEPLDVVDRYEGD